MKQKTVIEQAIAEIKSEADKLDESSNLEYNFKLGLLRAVEIIHDYTETNKEQIKDAYVHGRIHGVQDHLACNNNYPSVESELYYEDTFIETPLGEETTAPQQ